MKRKGKGKMNYAKLTDLEIRDLIVGGNEEAALYLIYDRYDKDIRYKVKRCFDNLEELENVSNALFMHLKGSKGDWQPLKTYRGASTFRTWFNSVIYNHCKKIRDEMIDINRVRGLIVDTDPNKPIPEPKTTTKPDDRLVMVMEAISKLKNDEYRIVIIKELEGYNHEEIAKMIDEKRKKENKVRTYRGEVVTPNAEYVDMIKARAVKELKLIVEQIKKEWYAD